MACIETRNITIKAKRDPTQYIGFKFRMYENDRAIDDETLVSEKELKHKKEADYHTFIFTLENEGTSDLAFLDNPFDVMWVKPGNADKPGKCPDRRSSDPDFCVGEVFSTRLVVHNANSRKCKHKFVLNFAGTKADGSLGVVPYDPIWSNGNGGSL